MSLGKIAADWGHYSYGHNRFSTTVQYIAYYRVTTGASPISEVDIFWYFLGFSRVHIVVLVLVAFGGNSELSHLHFGVAQTSVRNASVTKPYEPTVEDVLTPAVFVGIVNILWRGMSSFIATFPPNRLSLTSQHGGFFFILCPIKTKEAL